MWELSIEPPPRCSPNAHPFHTFNHPNTPPRPSPQPTTPHNTTTQALAPDTIPGVRLALAAACLDLAPKLGTPFFFGCVYVFCCVEHVSASA